MPLVFADLDHTLTPTFTLFSVGNVLSEESFIDSDDNERIQNVQAAFEAGEVDYKTFVITALELMALALKDRKMEAALLITQRYFASELELYPWVLPTFSDFASQGADLTIVSAEPEFITQAAADRFDAGYFSTILEVTSDGTYSGRVDHVLGSSQKGTKVKEKIEEAPHSDIYVFGDSGGDIGMLDLAEPSANAFCITPDSELSIHAQANGMTVVTDPFIAYSLLAR